MNEGENVLVMFLDNEFEILNNNSILKNELKESLNKIAEFYNLEISEISELEFETVIPKNRENRIKGIWKMKNET